jgi:hypothetical protein
MVITINSNSHEIIRIEIDQIQVEIIHNNSILIDTTTTTIIIITIINFHEMNIF